MSTLVEPAISTPAGIKRPDIVCWKDSSPCYIVDVTVVVDNADLTRLCSPLFLLIGGERLPRSPTISCEGALVLPIEILRF